MSFPEATPVTVRWCALFISIVFFISTAALVVQIIEAERTGVADYRPNPRLPLTEQVTKAASPKKFNEAVLLSEYYALFFGSLAGVSFWFFRKLCD